jgi:N-acyl-D-amino-acid deacylase
VPTCRGSSPIPDLLSEHEVLTFAKVLADRDEGFIELAYQETGEEARPLANETRRFFGKVAEVAKRPVLYQAVAPNAVHPEQHRERVRWLESCSERGLRIYGQGVTRRGGFEMTFADWNLFDDTEAWRDVTLGTREERKAKMQTSIFATADPSSRQDGPCSESQHFCRHRPILFTNHCWSRISASSVSSSVLRLSERSDRVISTRFPSTTV